MISQEQHEQFIDTASLSSLTGASIAVMLAGNVAQYVFNWNPRWFGLTVASVISIAVTLSTSHTEAIDLVVCILRAFQIYATAVGIATITGRKSSTHRSRNLPQKHIQPVRKEFLRNWY